MIGNEGMRGRGRLERRVLEGRRGVRKGRGVLEEESIV